jgi:uncharacterized protein involved in outer membrane biogenesis
MKATATGTSAWPRHLRNGAVAVAVAVAVYALLGFLVLPLVAKPRLESALTERFARNATLGRLEFNPFTLRARALEFALADREPKRFLLRFAALDADVSAASLRYRAPVFDAVRIERPEIDLVRNADGSYSIDDLVAKAAAEPDAPTPRFSLNNIEITEGSVALDDRSHARRIVVSDLGIGIPFLSSLQHDAQIRVTPRFGGAIDGARFALGGSATSPFGDVQEAALEWNLDALPLAPYASYMALPGGTSVSDGALTTRLKLAFVTDKGVARTIALSGKARVERLALARQNGTRLISAKAIDVGLAKLDWLGRSISIDRFVIEGPEGDLRRDADGTLEFARLSGMRNGASPGAVRPWRFDIAEASIVDGMLHVADSAVNPAFGAVVSNVRAEARRIASTGTSGTVALKFTVDDGTEVDLQSDVDLSARHARGRFAVTTLPVAKLHPYYVPVVNLIVRGGTLDVAGEFDAAPQGETLQFTLAQGTATLRDFETAITGEKEPLWRIAHGEFEGIAFDLEKRRAAVDRVALRQGSIRIARDANGAMNLQRLVPRKLTGAAATHGTAHAGEASPAFDVLIGKVDLERITADIEDRMAASPVKLRVADARATVTNVGNASGAKSAIDASARIGRSGYVRLAGALVVDPLAADWRIDAKGIDLVPLRPYFEPQTNIIVTGGSIDARGRATYATARDGSARMAYTGDAVIVDFATLDRPTSQELVRWKKLSLTGIKTTSEPFNLAIGAVGMDRFYARVILHEDATLNLRNLLAREPVSGGSAAAAPARTAGGVTTKELAPPSASQALPVSIGRIDVSNGEVQYADFFVKPNYNAHLTSVAGSVSALSPTQAGTVELVARVEGTAPVDVRGTVNPFARELQLDLTGKASDVDLPPLTPYSVKYAGYGIQKGKLSLEVHYRIEDRKLAASNKLRLDQLAFGERVDSPTATKLPVLLAVALLKDRNGVINLDLPIEGTLDDPKFSVWGVIVQIFVNLITKAVTAPFALLGAIAGGGGEQLAYIEFPPGRAEVTASGEQKLVTLAKALAERPALKIDATGRAIPDVDRAGLKRAMLERALRVQKQKAVATDGQSAASLESMTIDASEYEKLLGAVYRSTDLPDKPRNVFGIAKTIAPAEMEALLLASYRVDDEALATLANRRAQAVKEWFAGKGGVPGERVFIVAPKLTAAGIADAGAPTRVDFAIR